MDDGLLLGLASAFLVYLLVLKAGVRLGPTPARGSIAFFALAIALSLLLRVLGVFNPSTSVLAGFIAAGVALSLWTHFWRLDI